MTDLTYRDAIYGNAIIQHLEYFKKNKMKFNIFVSPENSDLSVLPDQAFLNGFLCCSFDYGAEESWITDQITIEDNKFNCVLVYKVGGECEEWDEFAISFPLINIVGITRIDGVKDLYLSEVSENYTDYTDEFRTLIENSKKHLKLVR